MVVPGNPAIIPKWMPSPSDFRPKFHQHRKRKKKKTSPTSPAAQRKAICVSFTWFRSARKLRSALRVARVAAPSQRQARPGRDCSRRCSRSSWSTSIARRLWRGGFTIEKWASNQEKMTALPWKCGIEHYWTIKKNDLSMKWWWFKREKWGWNREKNQEQLGVNHEKRGFKHKKWWFNFEPSKYGFEGNYWWFSNRKCVIEPW